MPQFKILVTEVDTKLQSDGVSEIETISANVLPGDDAADAAVVDVATIQFQNTNIANFGGFVVGKKYDATFTEEVAPVSVSDVPAEAATAPTE